MRLDRFDPHQTGFGARTAAVIAATALLLALGIILWRLIARSG
ncbi:hypothetical protein SAMN03159338_3351 [Sphingomonas sp. NFR04]|nr:hypothetical protein [Sphingomonas sp. NFR04]SFK13571.1 hypothetical protein SAMN03159338_3351 [Sphingomonas sp. NFR04]